MKNKIKLSYVIPCYNSERTISDVVKRIIQTVKKTPEYDYEIILVNDGSTDNVYKKLQLLSNNDYKIKSISLIRNFGQHAALITGLRYTTGEIVVCLDDDGQTPPEESIKLIKEIENDRDVVYAKYLKKQHSLFRNFGSRINNLMACCMLGKPRDLFLSSYFACKRIIVDEIIKYDNPYPYIQGLVLRTTNNISNVIIEHKKRESGVSGYSLFKLINLWMNGFTSFSIKPLKISTIIGCVSSMSGIIYGIIIIINKLSNKTSIEGYASIMAVILFIGGIILLMLGLIGEYIGRAYVCLNHSPQAIVRETININEQK